LKVLDVQEPLTWTAASNLRGLVLTMRPREWSKNLLVFSSLIFSKSLTDPRNLVVTVAGFAAFCAASSGVYLFNDLCDLKADREHPTKRDRPIASGQLNLNVARFAALTLFAAAGITGWLLNPAFAAVIAVYTITCIGYSLGLKNVVILDVILIATGFVLRAISGAVLINVVASEWLVLCTSMVALLIGFGKRRHELVLLEDAAQNHRKSLGEYSILFLDAVMNICAGAAVLTYALYTKADDTVARVGSHWMLATIPFVVYGVFRYLFLIHRKQAGGDPVHILFHDRPTLLNLLLWITAAGLVIYLPRFIG
jgi:4-hydroxybenzoate polyprenyltransferase